MANKTFKSPVDQARADFEAGKISLGQLDDIALANPEYPALFQLKKNYGDVLDTPSGRRYRIEEPTDKEGLKTWGKDHILLREINDKDEDVFDFGSHGWFPIGEFLKGGK